MSHNSRTITKRHPHRRGMALITVLLVLSFACVMGMGMLSASALQGQMAISTQAAARAEYLAESGVNLAMYYLQYPNASPKAWSDPFWTGGNNISLGDSVDGSVSVSIALVSTTGFQSNYKIIATGNVLRGGQSFSRVTTAVVQVDYEFKVDSSASFAGSYIRLPARTAFATGGAKINGNIDIDPGVTLTGPIIALGGNVMSLINFILLDSAKPMAIPSVENGGVNIDRYLNYTYNGRTYQADNITSQVVGGTIVGLPPAPSATNPAHVYYYDGNLTLQGAIISGTLVVRNGRLSIRGSVPSTIIPSIGLTKSMPALMVDKEINVSGLNARLLATGLVWSNNGVTFGGTTIGSGVTITGAAIFGSNALIKNSTGFGSVTIAYTPANVNVTDFSTVGAVPQRIRVASWNTTKQE
ncbi:MAG: hypothetical protein IT447_04240 [Phycisphaerales bacterium]|nr:hypothetical protein [Phycisphaerales bacterium]